MFYLLFCCSLVRSGPTQIYASCLAGINLLGPRGHVRPRIGSPDLTDASTAEFCLQFAPPLAWPELHPNQPLPSPYLLWWLICCPLLLTRGLFICFGFFEEFMFCLSHAKAPKTAYKVPLHKYK